MLDASGRPAFANARYVVQRDEAEAAHGDELRVQGIMEVEQLDAIRAAGQLAEVNGEVELVPGVRVLRTGGHTRGSQAVLIGLERPRRTRGRSDRAGDPVGRPDPDPLADPDALDVGLRRLPDRRHRDPQRARWRVPPPRAGGAYFTHDPGEMPVRIEATDRGGYRAADA